MTAVRRLEVPQTAVDHRAMHLEDPDLLEHIGLALYERRALMALMLCGVADAATLCREGGVPTSKIYLAMEKLAGLGLVQIQPTRPKVFAAFPTEDSRHCWSAMPNWPTVSPRASRSCGEKP